MKPKLVVIVGTTASGKSELAVKLAKKFNGEIISADSRQVYKGLDVGTAKVKGIWNRVKGERERGKRFNVFVYKSIPHYCIDFISPKRMYTVAKFKECAMQAIEDISSREKLPILVGGTGFWMDAVVYDVDLPKVAPNPRLRKELEKKSTVELFSLLMKLDSERTKTIEPLNPRRLIRAIEIAKSLGHVPRVKKRHPFDTLWLGFNQSKSLLRQRIQKRILIWTHSTSGNSSIIAETKKLLKKGVSRKHMRDFGFEYTAVLEFLDGNLTRQELVNQLITDSMHYAKRQMRWFKRNRDIRWIQRQSDVVSVVETWLCQKESRSKN